MESLARREKRSAKLNMIPLNIKKGSITIKRDIYVLKFPRELYEHIERAEEKDHNDGCKKTNIKYTYIKPLSEAIKGKHGEILAANNTINRNTLDSPWIYSFFKSDVDIIKRYIQEWFKSVSWKNAIDIPLEKLDSLEWIRQDVVVEFENNEAGTSIPGPEAFNLFLTYLGDRMSGELQASTVGMHDGKKNISKFDFYNVNMDSQGAELISWPPKTSCDSKSKKCSYWTYKIKMNIITIPFEARPYLNVDIQTLRFCSEKIYMVKGKNPTAYIRFPAKAVRNGSEDNFIRAKIIRIKDKRTDKWKWSWEHGLMVAAKNLMLTKYIPDAEEVMESPENFIDGSDERASVAVAFGSHIKGKKGGLSKKEIVGTGAAFVERNSINESVLENLKSIQDELEIDAVGNSEQEYGLISGFTVRENCRALKPRTRKMYSNFDGDDIDFKMEIIPNEMSIEVYFHNEDWLKKVIYGVKEFFKCREILGDKVKVDVQGMEITIASIDTEEKKTLKIIPVDTKKWDKEDGFFDVASNKAEYNDFVKELKSKLRKASGVVGALFELENAQAFEGSVDPKKTIRKVFAEKNRLTQFITPSTVSFSQDHWDLDMDIEPEKRIQTIRKHDKSVDNFVSGVRDLFRQLGVMTENISSYSPNSEKEVVYAGIWFTTQYPKIPILVAVKDNIPIMTFYRSDSKVEWKHYSDGQIELGTIDSKNKIQKLTPENLRGFIVRAIKILKEITDVDDIILYSRAQNCRSKLPWYTNGNINSNPAILTISKCEDEDQKAYGQSIDDCIPVRVRDREGGEVPSWIILGHDDEDGSLVEIPHSLGGGLYMINENVYYSIHGKGDTFKMGGEEIRSTKEDNPFENYKRQNIVEICVPFVKEGYDVKSIVDITHHMRSDNVSITTRNPIKLPLPLHLAKSACEYHEAKMEKLNLKK